MSSTRWPSAGTEPEALEPLLEKNFSDAYLLHDDDEHPYDEPRRIIVRQNRIIVGEHGLRALAEAHVAVYGLGVSARHARWTS